MEDWDEIEHTQSQVEEKSGPSPSFSGELENHGDQTSKDTF